MSVGENIKKIRKLRNMEQTELAEKLHISNRTVSSWETGRTEPKMGMIEAICDVFGCEKTELIDGMKSYNFGIMEIARRISELSPEQIDDVMRYVEFIRNRE